MYLVFGGGEIEYPWQSDDRLERHSFLRKDPQAYHELNQYVH